MDSQKYASKLISIAYKQKTDANRVLEDFLDYLIDTFEVGNISKFNLDYVAVFEEAKERNEDFFELMTAWFLEVTKSIEQGKSLDFFGKMYEETWKGKGKASALGQFYTPESICSLMAEITGAEQGRFNDCACGSGRTMLSAWEKTDKTKFSYYDTGDIDGVSCKMCALNMMVHGMIREVKQQDALTLETPHVVYKVNEVRYPFPCNAYSIRRVYPSKAKEENTEKVSRFKGKIKPKEETKPIEVAEAKPKEAVQLSLFE